MKELNDDGEPIEVGTVGDEIFTVEFSEGNEAVVSDSDDITTITFDNQFVEIPDGFYKIGELNITKKVFGADGSALKTNDVFYAGLFSDVSLTKLSDKVDANIIPLNMNGASEVTTTISLPVYPGDGYDLYIAEVDSQGNLVSKNSTFKYSVTYENDHIKMNEEAVGLTVTIKNTVKSGSTTTTTTTSSNSVRTGDDTPIDLYAYLAMAGVLLAAMAEVLRRRNRKNR